MCCSYRLSDHSPFYTNLWVNVHATVTVPQVPSEDWGVGYGGGGAADSGGEIPCRRMRSGSYIKAMGDDDSADSDTSPKASPKSTLIAQRDAFRRSISMDQRSSVYISGESLKISSSGMFLSTLNQIQYLSTHLMHFCSIFILCYFTPLHLRAELLFFSLRHVFTFEITSFLAHLTGGALLACI